jgi:hypothetical protein
MVRIRHQVSGWWIDHSPGRRYRERVRSQRGRPVSRLSFDLSRRCHFGREPRGKAKKPDGVEWRDPGKEGGRPRCRWRSHRKSRTNRIRFYRLASVAWPQCRGSTGERHASLACCFGTTLVGTQALLMRGAPRWFSDAYRECPAVKAALATDSGSSDSERLPLPK